MPNVSKDFVDAMGSRHQVTSESHMKMSDRPSFKSKSKSKALKKVGELESRSKKAGHYVHGHKNYGDVYES